MIFETQLLQDTTAQRLLGKPSGHWDFFVSRTLVARLAARQDVSSSPFPFSFQVGRWTELPQQPASQELPHTFLIAALSSLLETSYLMVVKHDGYSNTQPYTAD